MTTDKGRANRTTTRWLENYVDETDGDFSLCLSGDNLRAALDLLDEMIAEGWPGEMVVLHEEAERLRELFALQRTRMREATALWQAAMAKPDVFPDLGELIAWLIQRAESARREVWEKLCPVCFSLEHINGTRVCVAGTNGQPASFESCPRLKGNPESGEDVGPGVDPDLIVSFVP